MIYDVPVAKTAADVYMRRLLGNVNESLPLPTNKVEAFLYLLCGGDYNMPQPITSEERFLAYLLGVSDVTLPTPQTRLETYMDKVCRRGSNAVVPPKTRYELYWWLWANVREITSTSFPVMFQTVMPYLVNYKIYGNYALSRPNAIDNSQFEIGYLYDAEGELVTSLDGAIHKPIYCNGKITVNWMNAPDVLDFIFFNSSDTYISSQRITDVTPPLEVTPPENAKYFIPQIAVNSGAITDEDIESVGLAVTTQFATPDSLNTINFVGDKTGNIFSSTTWSHSGIRNEDGTASEHLTAAFSSPVSVTPDTTYYVKVFGSTDTTSYMVNKVVAYAGTDFIERIDISDLTAFVTPANCTNIVLDLCSSPELDEMPLNYDYKVVLSTQPIYSYEPYNKYKIPITLNSSTTTIYVDRPIASLQQPDGYEDFVEYKEQKIVRNIKEFIVDENTPISATYTTNLRPQVEYELTGVLADSIATSLCDKISYSPSSSNTAVAKNLLTHLRIRRSHVAVYVPRNFLPENFTAEDVKSFVKSLCPLKFYEPIAEPITENIWLPQLETQDGNNTLTVETTVPPSKVTIEV